ncbi:MAG: DivIVA domain-containing protein [Coriobacteriales bacterium]|jgi:cell division initiation protein|nr:DivIVA domain-containing protein [Coriobacteriales bacterium]
MSITAADIHQQSFSTSRHGYDPQEVDDFLELVAEEIDKYNLLIAEANNRIKAAEDRALDAEQQASRVEAAPVSAAVPAAGVSEDVISKAFIAAQRSADALKEEARQEAEKLYREAESHAREIVRDALTQKQKTLSEIDRLRASSERFRTDYLSLINHFQADAQKTFSSFESVVPAAPEKVVSTPAAKEVLRANDAVVAPAPAPAPAPVPVEAPAPAPAPAQASLALEENYSSFGYQDDDDDELDIEEID